MLKTLKPDEMNLTVSVSPGVAMRLNPKAIASAMKRTGKGGYLSRAYVLTAEGRNELRRMQTAMARRTSAHWHFRVSADGRPTAVIPTLRQPAGKHVRVPIRGVESALEAMDRCVDGWGDKDNPSRKLQWRIE